MDEISIGAPTRVAELKEGQISIYTITPEQFGIERNDIKQLVVNSAGESLAIIKGVLEDQPGAARDIVMLNAGAAIYAAGLADTLDAGIRKADTVIATGKAKEKLDALVKLSNSF
jgi:anthranilate phosphoribosyltransferase